MALYLQMDGVDDYIKLPSMTLNKIVATMKIRRRTDATRIIWDFRAGIGFSYLQQTSAGVDSWGSGTVKVDTVAKTNSTTAIPNDTKCIIEHSLSTGTDDGNIFINNGASVSSTISGDIFDIKIYNGATLVAWYDMTTGTVQDQSGNGRHATLTGGTWLDDGTGGGTPTGTDGSTAFDIRQSLCADSSFNTDIRNVLYTDSFTAFDTLQQLFESGTDGAIPFDVFIRLYQDSAVQMDARQSIYSDSSSAYDTKLSFYQDSATLFDTLQEFFSDGIVGSTPFDLRFVLYADSSALYDSKQAFYSDGASFADLSQQFYQAGGTDADIKLVIYADASTKYDASQTLYSDSSVKADMTQRYYTEGTLDFDTLQAILEDWAQYNEVIQIVLNITRKKTAALDITQRKQSELKL